MPLIIDKTLISDFDSLVEVEAIVDEISAEAGLDEDQKAGLMLSASEATTNAMLHGNKMDPGKIVTIHAEAIPGKALYSAEDQGEGFNPDDVANPLDSENLLKPSGRGVFLMRTYCDEVSFDKGGRRVTLVVKS